MMSMKSSLEAASEAAQRVNALLIAKGKLKLPPTNKLKNQTVVKSTGELYMAEIEINDAPLVARNMLTRGVTQDEINKLSGAAVSTRGRYMTFEDISKNPNERPLYLHVQASTKEAVDAAVDKIHKIVEQQLKATGSTMSWSRSATTTRTGPTSSSLVFLSTNTPAHYVQDKLFVGLEHAPVAFQVKEKILGPGELHLNHIRLETGATVSLRGKGSGSLDPASGREAFEPLHIHLMHSSTKGLQSAKELAVNLIQTIQQEYTQWQQQQTLAVITVQNPGSALGVQQVAFQQTLGVVNTGALGLNVTREVPDLSQSTLQNAQIQIGSVASNLIPTLTPALATTVPNLLSTAQGSQLQLIQGQVLNLGGGVTGVVPTVVPAVVTTSTVNLLPQASHVVYTPAYQHAGGALVQVTQPYIITQPQVSTTTTTAYQQQQQLARVATLQTQQTSTQSATSTTSMYYLLSQPTPTSTATQVQNDVQLQAQQMLVQAQNQSRLLQQRLSPSFSQHQIANSSVAVPASAAVSYPQYRIQGETFNSQKRKLQDDCDMRDSYLQRMGRLATMTTQQPATSSSLNYDAYSPGLQSGNPLARQAVVSSYGMSSNVSLARSNDKDQQLMPPPSSLPSLALSKVGNHSQLSRNLEIDNKRHKSGMWNVSNSYNSGCDDDEESSRLMQRSSTIPRYYTNQQARFGTALRGEGVWLSSPSSASNISNQNSYNQSGNAQRYQYQGPFWMAPN